MPDATDYIAEAITGQWGDRCPDFAEGCACCEAWAQYDRLTALEQENKRLREALETSVQAWGTIPSKSTPVMDCAGILHLREHPHDASGCYEAMIRAALTHEDKTDKEAGR